MPFIGNQPALSYTSFAKQDFTTSATTSYTLDQPVANANELALFINFVRQEPTTAYSASGTTLTLTSATSASDDMYCVYLGKAVQTVNPPNASVGSSQVSADLITGQTALGATPADTDELLISDAGTLKRVDYSYLKSANTPAFSAYLSASQTINQDTHTTAQFNTEVFDTDNCFDTSTYRFTPTSSGKYLIGAEMMVSKDAAELKVALMRIRKNGSIIREVRIDIRNSTGKQFGPAMIITAEANGSSDYFDVSFYADNTEATADISGGSTGSIFYGYKIIE